VHPKGKYVGALSFGYFSFGQAKKSHSPQWAKPQSKFKNKLKLPPEGEASYIRAPAQIKTLRYSLQHQQRNHQKHQ